MLRSYFLEGRLHQITSPEFCLVVNRYDKVQNFKEIITYSANILDREGVSRLKVLNRMG